MYCTASRLMMAVIAVYLLGNLSHDAVVTWAVVAAAVPAVLVWSHRRGSGSCSVGQRDVRCAERRGAGVAVSVLVGTSIGTYGEREPDCVHATEDVQ